MFPLQEHGCVAKQWTASVQQHKHFKKEEMKKAELWTRGDFVRKQGWSTMPGEKISDNADANKCADIIAG
ncbi:MAG: hypothetical protein ISR52_07830 [Rhodospirillales bacterium]|nr:hypothetical protein [Rhodospirillales bacterium]